MKRPFLIGVGGSESGVGKTTLCCAILEHFRGRSPFSAWGAVKFTRTLSGPEVITDPAVLAEAGKDTARLSAAGASKIIWVRSRPSRLPEVMPDVVRGFAAFDAVLIEGNSAIEITKPDIVILIFGKNRHLWKQGLGRHAAAADLVVAGDRAILPKAAQGRPAVEADVTDPRGLSEVIRQIARLIDERKAERGDAEKGCGQQTRLRRGPEAGRRPRRLV